MTMKHAVVFLAAFLTPTAAFAISTDLTVEVKEVIHLDADLYEVRTQNQTIQVLAPAASALPDLQNPDAFSEAWFCSLEKAQDKYTLKGCVSGRAPK